MCLHTSESGSMSWAVLMPQRFTAGMLGSPFLASSHGMSLGGGRVGRCLLQAVCLIMGRCGGGGFSMHEQPSCRRSP